MVKDFSKILALDLELTCWESDPPEGERPEIIQIGVCLYDVAKAERSGRLSILVKPQASSVSEYCTRLTGITPLMLKKHGVTLDHACKRMLNLGYKKYAWTSFGVGDRHQIETQTRDGGLVYPLNACHFDLSALGSIIVGAERSAGQNTLLERFGVEREGTCHDASWDAWNLAALIPFVLRLPAPQAVDLSPAECTPSVAPPG